MQETVILPLDNNDIINYGMMQKKKGLRIWWWKKGKRASITENYIHT